MPAFFPALASAGLIRGAAGSALNALYGSARQLTATAGRALPGAGMVAAGTIAGGAALNALTGQPMRRRRRGRGFTSRDISQFKRMSKVINELQGCLPKRKCR